MSSIIYLDDYETRYFVFYDHQIYNKWCFVNIKKGVFFLSLRKIKFS